VTDGRLLISRFLDRLEGLLEELPQREMEGPLGVSPSRRFDGCLSIAEERNPQPATPSQPREQSTEEA
jgi:hypothetical protein